LAVIGPENVFMAQPQIGAAVKRLCCRIEKVG